MYTEFIIIFVFLGCIGVISIINLVLLIILLSKQGNTNMRTIGTGTNYIRQGMMNTNHGGAIFCRKCATQYDASYSNCPNCGMPR